MSGYLAGETIYGEDGETSLGEEIVGRRRRGIKRKRKRPTHANRCSMFQLSIDF